MVATPTPNPLAKSYLCVALHALPDNDLLASYSDSRSVGRYSTSWLKRGLRYVASGATCIAQLQKRNLALLPMPQSIEALDAPYSIGYDFYFTQLANNGKENYIAIARYYGFVIATLPSHDWRRSLAFATVSRSSEALMYADRTILSLCQLRPEAITASLEKSYSRFAKLLALYLDQAATPEGQLAARRALEVAHKCYSQLT